MNSTFIKIIFRSIRDSIVRFLAILAITALGVGFFSGLKATTPSLNETANQFINEYKLYDLRLISTIGFDDEDIEKISKLDKVTSCEGAYFKDALVSRLRANSEVPDDYISVVRFHSLTSNVNTLKVEEGRLPTSPNEVVLDGYQCGSSWIGDKIIIDSEDGFTEKTLTVVGIVRSPYYLNFQRGSTDIGGGSIGFFAYTMPETFDFEYYVEAFVTLDSDYYIYSDEYDDFIEEYIDYAEPQIQSIIDERFDTLIGDARAEYEDGVAEYNDKMGDAMTELGDAYSELVDAREELSDARIEIEDATKELEDAATKLEDADATLDEAQLDLQAAELQIADAEDLFAEQKAQLDELGVALDELLPMLPELEAKKAEVETGIETINQNLPTIEAQIETLESMYSAEELAMSPDYLTLVGTRDALQASLTEATDGLAEIDASILQINTLKDQYDAGIEAYDTAYAEFSDKKAQYESSYEAYTDGRASYLTGLSEYEDGKASLEDGIKEYEDGLKEYNDGYLEYLDGQREIAANAACTSLYLMHIDRMLDDFDEPDTYVLGRDTNIGYVCFENDAQIVDRVAAVFPLFFFAIAALVCSTTMQRMVADERVQIGSMRALGYSSGTIVSKYVIYSGLAAILGCVGGFIGGTKLFPFVIWDVYGMMYGFTDLVYKQSALMFIISLVVSLICSVGVTVVTCVGEFKEQPAELVRPKAPTPGKRILLERISFIWSKLKFLHKVSARNVFRFKKRMWMMIIGIAGCTALVLTGFGLQDSIKDVVNLQYDKILTYDSLIMFESGTSTDEISSMIKNSEDKLGVSTSYALINQRIIKHTSDSGIRSIELISTSDEGILSYVNPHSDGQNFTWPEDGKMGVSAKLAKATGMKAGDIVTFDYGDNGESFDVEIAYVFENYIFHYAVMNANTYEMIFGEAYEPTGVLLSLPDGTEVTDLNFASDVASDSRVKSWSAISESRDRFQNTMNQLNAVIILVIGCAAALAFIVLFNLNNINITERVREIATLKVLGFNRKETGSYVFRENTILVLMGFVVGIPLGIALHAFVMEQIAMDTVTFQIIIKPISYVVSLGTVLLFSIIVDLVMRIKIEKIDMAESLKSIE